MSFVLSKIVWALVSPAALLLLALAGALWWQRRRPGLSRGLLASAAVFVGALILCPIGTWAIAPLEHRFPPPSPSKVDGIIVLGGAIDSGKPVQPEVPYLNDAAERITTLVALARRYPDAKLVYSGGSGLVRDQSLREAALAQPLLESMGVPAGRVIYEPDSRNTWENALYSKKLAEPKPGETWLLVTSAWHMPRSVGCFRRAGWNVVPYPVDYQSWDTRWADFEPIQQLFALSLAEKEWIGLLAYHLLGRTDALFPGPKTAH